MNKNNLSWQEKLNDLLQCDLKSLFPVARELKRELYFFVGPTNSGKTYQAMQELMEADCGSYLAPLRLLALENYEYLIKNDIPTSLITGEEERIDEDAAHICSTIEMVNFSQEIDVCVIDEVQMLEDPDRGWAWVNAIVGAPSSKVIMTGSVNALEAIKKIASYLEEDLKVVKFQRKNPLKAKESATSLKDLEKNTALIAFSRSEVLRLKSKLSKEHTISVIYGNLSPEVRQEEARRFREGESDILIATDAIAMGLNLPIKTLLFTTHEKYDGISQRGLKSNEIIQISGRAGRYGHHEAGFIGATNKKSHIYIAEKFNSPLHTIKPPFAIKATTQQILSLSEHLKSSDLKKILNYFAKHMNFTGPFIATNISSMIELSTILDPMKELSLKDKYMLAGAPVSTRSPLIKRAFLYYVNAIIKKEVVTYKSSISTQKIAKTQLDLLKAEDEVKKISLYLWLAYKMPELFVDSKEAELARIRVNHYCEKSLKSNSLLKAPQRKRRDDKDKKHHNRYKRENERKQDDDNDKRKTRRRRRR
jgi:ATP-dependent RNA helicase SUPV3L1/SUV3